MIDFESHQTTIMSLSRKGSRTYIWLFWRLYDIIRHYVTYLGIHFLLRVPDSNLKARLEPIRWDPCHFLCWICSPQLQLPQYCYIYSWPATCLIDRRPYIIDTFLLFPLPKLRNESRHLKFDHEVQRSGTGKRSEPENEILLIALSYGMSWSWTSGTLSDEQAVRDCGVDNW